MIEEIPVAKRSLADYEKFGQDGVKNIRNIGQKLSGKRILHINSTAQGGGVAELLKSQISLERSAGLDSRWFALQPQDSQFFSVTKRIHNFLQGNEGELTTDEQELYVAESKRISEALEATCNDLNPDIIIAHDPQPLLAVHMLPVGTRILRFHVDMPKECTSTLEWLATYISSYARIIVSREDCVATCLPVDRATAIAPAIDPLAPKNQPTPPERVHSILVQHGIDPNRPLITQVSRFDLWKDPVGVVQAFQQAFPHTSEAQLALVGFITAEDDPEANLWLQKTQKAAKDAGNIFLFHDTDQLKGITNDEFVAAIQQQSDVIVQKSLREGFGLTVTEAMWKAKAVIGGNAGGIALQIDDELNGILVDSVEETAEAMKHLVHNPELRVRLGEAAKASVRKHYLMPRYIADNLRVYAAALQGDIDRQV